MYLVCNKTKSKFVVVLGNCKICKFKKGNSEIHKWQLPQLALGHMAKYLFKGSEFLFFFLTIVLLPTQFIFIGEQVEIQKAK